MLTMHLTLLKAEIGKQSTVKLHPNIYTAMTRSSFSVINKTAVHSILSPVQSSKRAFGEAQPMEAAMLLQFSNSRATLKKTEDI